MAVIPLLKIGSVTLDDYADITSINAVVGRTTITEQPSPSTFSCSFSIFENQFIGTININDIIRWKISPSGTQYQIFFGYVTDISITTSNWGSGTGLVTYQITGVGSLNDLNRVTVGGAGYAKEFAGTRIYNILTDAGITTTGITTPGDYEIAVYNDGPTDALSLAQLAANSSMGVLFEDHANDGLLTYQTYANRKNNTQITLTNADISASNFGASSSINNVINQASVTYAAGTSTIFDNTTSQTTYGRVLSGSRDTTLHNLTDANTIAEILLASKASAIYNLSTIEINLAYVSSTLKAQLAAVKVGTRIHVTGIPFNEITSFDGFVEGFTWKTARNQEIVTLNVVNYGTQYPYTLWNQLNGTSTWNTIYTSTTKWSDVT